MIKHKILLASASPRRSFLLEQMDLDFRVYSSDVDEIIPEHHPIEDVPAYLAKLKGEASAHERRANEILVAADTIVVFENEILGKPTHASGASETLQRLQGKFHQVISGVYMTNGRQEKILSVTTDVEMEAISQEEIAYYVNRYQPMDKAGSYGIQEWIGWAKVKSIKGSYSNIMGLPTREVYRALSDF